MQSGLRKKNVASFVAKPFPSVHFSWFVNSLPQGIRWADFREPAWASFSSFPGPRWSWAKFGWHHSWPWTLWYVFVSPVSRVLIWSLREVLGICDYLPLLFRVGLWCSGPSVLSVFMAIVKMSQKLTSGERLLLTGLNNAVINLINNSPKFYSLLSWMTPLLLWHI